MRYQNDESSSRIMHVLYQSDENYAVPTCISLYSLLKNNKTIDGFVFHIIDNGLSDMSKSKLEGIVKEYSQSIDWIDGAEFAEHLKSHGFPTYKNSYTTYMKLLGIDRVVERSPEAEWLLYLDGDTIIVGDLGGFLELQIDDRYIFGIYEYTHPLYRQHLELLGNNINAGVFVIHLNEWKLNNDGKKIDAIYRDEAYIANLWLHDQDILNHLFEKHIHPLSPAYNLTHAFYLCHNSDIYAGKFGMSARFYSRDEIEQSIAKPVIIHYMDVCWNGMPWERWNANHWARDYRKYKNECWREGRDPIINKSLKRKIVKAFLILANKIFPCVVKAEIYYYESKILSYKKIG